ncbi:pyridoxamine 5'-phosphate oxidase family protein [Nocardia bovistercoris]|uniref:Pyridoxamine 5'-phosphate oxidase family protein n=1 Tax=Nocardia bovistercoris TaxID=2785916 RepID=A0A931N3J5_9NOCA|nr:pyridoxamine 5'-phosphate oxidase family protein [Nocardia bovistercoris]MBH0777802.1 pyridoxamine 5'-phosphate oxidase family protein [Nocardia bovistercoris]
MISKVPAGYEDLLERPIVGVLATVTPHGAPDQTPMRFKWDGARLRMSHTIPRRKFTSLQANPNYSFLLTDPDKPSRCLQTQGWLITVLADEEGKFYRELNERYGEAENGLPDDVLDRVVLILDATRFTAK